MEWNQLQKFLIVAKTESFSRSAELLHMTQPSLSQTIKRLENELGFQLFTREGKKVFLNESGRIFLQTVIQMDEMMQNTKTRLEEINHIQHTDVSIRISTASRLLPDLLLYLKKRNPQIQYHIHQLSNDIQMYEEDIQILSGVSGSQPLLKGDELLLEEEILLAVPNNHRLSKLDTIPLNELLWEEFILLSREWELGKIVHNMMEQTCIVPKTTMVVDNPNMMRELLKSHLGIAFIPSRSWNSFAGEEIVLKRVETIHLSRFIYLHTSPGKYLTKEQKECIAGIREFFSDFAKEAPLGNKNRLLTAGTFD